jgi:hypothetical protein
MAPQGSEFQDTISGNFYEIAIVEKFDETDESETFLANTTAGFETTHEKGSFSVNPSNGRVVYEASTHVTLGISFSSVYAPGMQPLVDAGIVDDSDGTVEYTPEVSAIRIYVYGETPENISNPSSDAAETIVFPNCQLDVNAWNFPADGPVEFPFSAMVREKPIIESLASS